ncbi:hypothetical protein Axy04_067 [Achromobacter phage vB_AxyP_19-32_Axy04]|uniref:Uncharacterized protein n=1 Tax=Achromobacter phage vB_AxyP_19-32_Axy04 TaxID=2591039 RepID=A0A514CTJ7_9CAUD|nr:holin [Achromobacter phage vB_AxyP_19-32_Axy04]QDH83786.1 hypothetical protein Axy04_067 [Achromobacter phage vB_AxyP_19-32_Axy04]
MAGRRKLIPKVTPKHDWRCRLKRASWSTSALGGIIFAAAEFLQMGFFSLPKHLLEKIPYGSSLALTAWAIVQVARLFNWKRKDHGSDEKAVCKQG